jgi:phosphoglycolate phosphatase
MVGDAAPDIAAAHAAGSRAAWAGWGYGHAPAPAERGVWRLRTPQELLAALAMPVAADTEH